MRNSRFKLGLLTALIFISSIVMHTSFIQNDTVQAINSEELIYTESSLQTYSAPNKGKLKTKLKAGIYRKYAKSGKWVKVKNDNKKFVWINKSKNLNTKYSKKYQKVEEGIIVLINKERAKKGLKKLTLEKDMKKYTTFRSEEMAENNYFGHASPVYGRWVNLLYTSEYDFDYAGENLAAGFVTADDFVKAWMASPTHRKNILNPYYTKTTISIIDGKAGNQYQTYATQWFEK